MTNWMIDGWTESDWDNLTETSGDLRAIVFELDNAIGGGGGGFEPRELSEFAERLQAAADRMKRVAEKYI